LAKREKRKDVAAVEKPEEGGKYSSVGKLVVGGEWRGNR
jgi:hypothetical protein